MVFYSQSFEDLVNQEQTKIMQTSNALNQCCGADSAFASSPEAVECHKILLIACEYIINNQCVIVHKQIDHILGGSVSLLLLSTYPSCV